ncbi:MAG TPA: hypothetical protein VK668_22455 [Mucilaginibacter sp.]|nr:hypothetical protein [Mucilaginibacter sp.]
MTLNKIILIAIVLPCLSFQKDNRPKKTMLLNDHLEILNGNVKQIIETGIDSGGSPLLMRYGDTTSFDRRGNALERRIGYGIGSRKLSLNTYTNSYNEKGMKTETIIETNKSADKNIYKYDQSGHIVKSWVENKKKEKKFQTSYKYDVNGKVIEIDYILSANYGLQRLLFKYNSKGMLVEQNLFSGNNLADKSLFQYPSFDSKNNWTKRICTSEFGGQTPGLHQRDTSISIRKITYY